MVHNTTRVKADECKPPDAFNASLQHDEDSDDSAGEDDGAWIEEEAERQQAEHGRIEPQNKEQGTAEPQR